MSSAPSSKPRVAPRSLKDNLIPLLVLAAAIAGLLVGGVLVGGYAPQPRVVVTTQPIAHDGLRVQVPRGWTVGGGASTPGFRDPLRLRNGDKRAEGERGATAGDVGDASARRLPGDARRRAGAAHPRPRDWAAIPRCATASQAGTGR